MENILQIDRWDFVMRLIIEGPDEKDYFRPRELNCRLALRRQTRARFGMWADFYVRLIEDAEAKLQKAFELRSFDEVAKLRREIDNYRAILERVK